MIYRIISILAHCFNNEHWTEPGTFWATIVVGIVSIAVLLVLSIKTYNLNKKQNITSEKLQELEQVQLDTLNKIKEIQESFNKRQEILDNENNSWILCAENITQYNGATCFMALRFVNIGNYSGKLHEFSIYQNDEVKEVIEIGYTNRYIDTLSNVSTPIELDELPPIFKESPLVLRMSFAISSQNTITVTYKTLNRNTQRYEINYMSETTARDLLQWSPNIAI